MRIKSMILKALISSVLASVVTLIATLLINIILVPDTLAAQQTVAVILSVVSSSSFSVLLVYLFHIYNANGEGEVWEDYPEEYCGPVRDLPLVIKKEYKTLLFILAISFFNLILMILNRTLINSNIINVINGLFVSVSSLSLIFLNNLPQQAIGYICGSIFTCFCYVIIFTAFRWKWRRFM